MIKATNGLQILDCTPRDGGYINNWHFDKRMVREVYRAVSNAGVNIFEIGFHGTNKYFDRKEYGIWRFCPEEALREVTDGIKGADIALMCDFGKADIADIPDAKDSLVKMIRMAVHKDNLKPAIEFLEAAKNKGYQVSLNAMALGNYTAKERQELVAMVRSASLDYIYVVDSYGSLFPDQIKSLVDPFIELDGTKVGFHPHNSLQMAFANTLEAIRCGIDIVDSTIYGMGRGAGNLPTEILISYLETSNHHKYNAVPILNCINCYFISMQEEESWGYQLPYMLSGIFQCHPNYAQALTDAREYAVEDIRNAMAAIKRKDPIGFSKQTLDEVMNEGILSNLNGIETSKKQTATNHAKAAVKYVDRYAGRDFLVLANGPNLKKHKEQIDKFIEKYDPIILGANYLGDLYRPHYHAFNNKIRFTEYIDQVDASSKLLLGQHLPNEMIGEYLSRDYESLYYNDVLDADFDIVDGIIQSSCRTISVLLLGVAIVMGGQRIFAAGMDGYIEQDKPDNKHFYKEEISTHDSNQIIETHWWCHHFIKQIDEYLCSRGKEGVHILTHTGYKSFYTGIENYI
ncbi:MAG: hypothetical protein HN929_09775 [Chloroflexi bacterium]|jgi:4-hydroxy 2-oxovalerate aldolase|nr:hypothetical protein [Chloroflexota bacterium]MBT7081737.1 hypothetical protein [Chloroflexota bacterium]MBT7289969.1 hypothetical protein [Chloroflexota bacterium]